MTCPRPALAANRRYLVDQHGEPLFFLADTAWNGALKASPEDWERYLDIRAAQGFTAIQFVLTHWRGAAQPRAGRIFEEVDGRVVTGESALQAMDRSIAAIVDRGMIPVPVMFWVNNPLPAAQPESWMQSCMCNPYFSEAGMIEVGRRMLERWQHHHPIWLLVGDGDYRGSAFSSMLKRVGRAVFAAHPDAVASVHPCGTTWVNDIFADEAWYRLATLQSGHGGSAADMYTITAGPYATRWPVLELPFLNIEPNYEDAQVYGCDERHDALSVRRASWWSLLAAPTAGITYGTTAVWAWLERAGACAEGHGERWSGSRWDTCLHSDGIASMQVLRAVIGGLPWHELRPCPQLLAEQPGWMASEAMVVAAATDDERLLLAYSPSGADVVLSPFGSGERMQASWIEPRTGQRQTATAAGGDLLRYPAPSAEDWLLVLTGD